MLIRVGLLQRCGRGCVEALLRFLRQFHCLHPLDIGGRIADDNDADHALTDMRGAFDAVAPGTSNVTL